MAWTDRIKEAAYSSPAGTRVVFQFEDVSQEFTKKTAAFEFTDADGTFVQDLGHSGRRYPLRVIFWGTDYDLEADKFLELLEERGTGKLEHPLYGTVDVVPFGRIRRRDDLKSAANQAVIEVVFWQTIGTIYPEAQFAATAAVVDAIAGFNAAVSENFGDVTELDSAVETTSFRNLYQTILDVTSSTLSGIADTQKEIKKRFEAVRDSITKGLDILVGQPATLAAQTVLLIQIPGQSVASIGARLTSYRSLINATINSGVATLFPGSDDRVPNAFHTRDLFALSYITGSVTSVLANEFATKTDALDAAEELLSQLDDVTEWREANFESLDEIDTGEAYQQALDAVSFAAGFLVEISFSLKQERSVVLDRARSIVDLEGEFYGTVDDNLDFLIASNNFTGDEILTVPKGREVVYYA